MSELMNECHNCGAQLTQGARFCAACGAPADSEQTRYASDFAIFKPAADVHAPA